MITLFSGYICLVPFDEISGVSSKIPHECGGTHDAFRQTPYTAERKEKVRWLEKPRSIGLACDQSRGNLLTSAILCQQRLGKPLPRCNKCRQAAVRESKRNNLQTLSTQVPWDELDLARSLTRLHAS